MSRHAIRISIIQTSNIFVNITHEMAAFMYNVNKINSIQDGFFSPGILYPLDRKNTTRLANEALDWFEDAIGQYMSSIVQAYEGIKKKEALSDHRP